MREEGGVPDEERVSCLGVDEIKDGVHSCASDFQTEVSVSASFLGVAVGHACGEACAGGGAFPPFPGLEADVSVLCQEFGEFGHLVDVFEHFLTVGPFGGIVAGDAVLVRVLSADEGG